MSKGSLYQRLCRVRELDALSAQVQWELERQQHQSDAEAFLGRNAYFQRVIFETFLAMNSRFPATGVCIRQHSKRPHKELQIVRAVQGDDNVYNIATVEFDERKSDAYARVVLCLLCDFYSKNGFVADMWHSSAGRYGVTVREPQK